MAKPAFVMCWRSAVASAFQRIFAMGELTEKAKGLGNEIAGKTKAVVADATDNPKLRVEAELQQAKGEAQKIQGSVEGALGDKI
jgi:uncharacterized protein YjbJ (UPF0337 family)